MSKSSSPTLSKVFPIFNLLIDNVEKFIDQQNSNELGVLYNAGHACLDKLKKYYEKTDHCDLYPVATSNS